MESLTPYIQVLSLFNPTTCAALPAVTDLRRLLSLLKEERSARCQVLEKVTDSYGVWKAMPMMWTVGCHVAIPAKVF